MSVCPGETKALYLHPPSLEYLIRTTFIYFRKFLLNWVSISSLNCPSISVVSLNYFHQHYFPSSSASNFPVLLPIQSQSTHKICSIHVFSLDASIPKLAVICTIAWLSLTQWIISVNKLNIQHIYALYLGYLSE